MGSFDEEIWSRFWRSAQVIVKDLFLAILLVLGLAALSWLLHQEWIGLSSGRVDIIEGVHFWFSISLMVVFPLFSLGDIFRHEIRR